MAEVVFLTGENEEKSAAKDTIKLVQHNNRPVLQFADGRVLSLDFLADSRYRRTLRGKNELLAKAVGYKANPPPRVWDLSLGLAEDAWTLVRLGCQVTGFERNEFLAQLVAETHRSLLSAYSEATSQHQYLQRLRAFSGEAAQVLRYLLHQPIEESLQSELDREVSLRGAPQVLYFDPMFAGTSKSSALPRLEMQLLRSLLGEDPDQADVLALARSVPGMRVVVKRPLKAAKLFEDVTHTFSGEKVRYDMYQNTEIAK